MPQGSWVHLTAIALAVIALLVFLWAMFADRSRGRRRCPKCWYNMQGTPGLRCSECGQTARRERAMFRTRRRRVLAVIAVMVMLASLFTMSQEESVRERGLIAGLPTTVLLYAQRWRDDDVIYHELYARSIDGWFTRILGMNLAQIEVIGLSRGFAFDELPAWQQRMVCATVAASLDRALRQQRRSVASDAAMDLAVVILQGRPAGVEVVIEAVERLMREGSVDLINAYARQRPEVPYLRYDNNNHAILEAIHERLRTSGHTSEALFRSLSSVLRNHCDSTLAYEIIMMNLDQFPGDVYWLMYGSRQRNMRTLEFSRPRWYGELSDRAITSMIKGSVSHYDFTRDVVVEMAEDERDRLQRILAQVQPTDVELMRRVDQLRALVTLRAEFNQRVRGGQDATRRLEYFQDVWRVDAVVGQRMSNSYLRDSSVQNIALPEHSPIWVSSIEEDGFFAVIVDRFSQLGDYRARVPEWIALRGTYSPAEVVVLERLSRHWKPDTRAAAEAVLRIARQQAANRADGD